MKTNLEKLRELLCTVPEIEKDLNGTEILYRCSRVWEAWDIGTMAENDFEEVEINSPLQERHLRMYCEKHIKLIDISISSEGYIYRTERNQGMNLGGAVFVELDNSKDLENQSEETLGKIYDFLTRN